MFVVGSTRVRRKMLQINLYVVYIGSTSQLVMDCVFIDQGKKMLFFFGILTKCFIVFCVRSFLKQRYANKYVGTYGTKQFVVKSMML